MNELKFINMSTSLSNCQFKRSLLLYVEATYTKASLFPPLMFTKMPPGGCHTHTHTGLSWLHSLVAFCFLFSQQNQPSEKWKLVTALTLFCFCVILIIKYFIPSIDQVEANLHVLINIMYFINHPKLLWKIML